MKRMKVLATALLALLFHIVLGWAWTFMAGVIGGFWQGRWGWRTGGLGVGLSWLAVVAYSYVVAPAPIGRMTEIVGGIFGGLPGVATLAATLLIGLLLGTAGGGLGTQARLLQRHE